LSVVGKTARELQKMTPKGLESLTRLQVSRGVDQAAAQKTGAMERSLEPFEIA
jgi:hypothetical protein